MPSGRGLLRAVPRIAPWQNLFALPDFTSYAQHQTLAQDWYFAGRGPVTATEIPWTWISGPLRVRQDPPLNSAAVSVQGGSTSYSASTDSVDSYGQWPFSKTLTTATPSDAQNLADFVTGYYPDPRVRLPQLRLLLNRRTDTECWRILGREVGDRITITDTPTGWPAGATELVIEGIAHSSAVDVREVFWSTAPVIGEDADVTGPWFRLGVSTSDVLPY